MSFILSRDIITHQKRVANLSKSFSVYLGDPEADTAILYAAARWHDIGKPLIPNSILNKPDKLTEEEFNIVKSHPEKGAKMLKLLNADKIIIEIVQSHHENFDGSGYPKGLKGEDILYLARILKIADVYDALTHKRCYRPEIFGFKEALLIMGKMKEQFDPRIYSEFTKYIAAEIFQIERRKLQCLKRN